ALVAGPRGVGRIVGEVAVGDVDGAAVEQSDAAARAVGGRVMIDDDIVERERAGAVGAGVPVESAANVVAGADGGDGVFSVADGQARQADGEACQRSDRVEGE